VEQEVFRQIVVAVVEQSGYVGPLRLPQSEKGVQSYCFALSTVVSDRRCIYLD
jgi:hypothetical protein